MAFGDFLNKFKFTDPKDEEDVITNQIATDTSDGAIELTDGLSQYSLSLDWTYSNQIEQIDTYRSISEYSMVDYAIEDIINEAVSFAEDEDPITLDLSNVPDELLSDKIRDHIYESWENINRILDLKDSAHRRIRALYVDGRVSYQKVIKKNKPKDGIVGVIELDPRFVTKVRNVNYDDQSKTISSIDETFVYNENIQSKSKEKNKDSNNKRNKNGFDQAFEINPDSITYITSGRVDQTTGSVVGFLHKAVKPANQLRMMENALVIYRISRAPERRIFYVDVSNLPKSKAEAYLRNIKNSYRNKMSFNPESGSFADQRHLETMQEDYWLPRSASGKGTEVTTLQGGQNLDQIEDVIYFQKELYKALNIPLTRLQSDSFAPLGRAQEISRDEIKFSKFISKLRKRFNLVLLDLLKSDVILKSIITTDEWSEIKRYIGFKYAQDMYLEEMKKSELLRDRIDLAEQAGQFVGKYYSNEFVQKEILQQTETEIEENDKQIDKEASNPKFKQEEDI